MKPPGTKFDLFKDLEIQVHKGITLESVIRAVKAYWNHESNVAARAQKTTREESAKHVIKMRLDLDVGAEECIERAKTHPYYWHALREYSYDLVSEGRDVPSDFLKILLHPEGPPKFKSKPSGKDPKKWHRDLQLALAVLAVYRGSEFEYVTATHDSNAKNAYAVVANATGEDYYVVMKAWKQQPRVKEAAQREKKRRR